jgi:hypothetical protein
MTQLNLVEFASRLCLREGEARKEEGISRVSGNSALFLSRMRHVAEDYSYNQGSVTTDDLRGYASTWGIVPHHSAAWGAIFKGKNWKCIGRQKSAWPPNHAREIRVWKWEK